MKKIEMICLVIILAITIIVANCTVVNASSATINLQSETNTIKKGETFQVNVRLSNVVLGNGATGVLGNLDYDQNVLELIEENQENQVVNSWTKTYNPETKALLIDRATNTKEEQTIAVLTFKVKDATKATETTIKYQDIKVNDENEQVDVNEASITLKIVAEGSQNVGDNGNTPSNNNDSSNNNGNSNNNNNKEDQSKEESNVEDNKNSSNSKSSTGSSSTNSNSSNSSRIPKLGAGDGFIMIGIICIVIVAAGISFIKYRRYKGL